MIIPRHLLLLALLAVLPACDRRDDPSVPPGSTGSSTPPGERVDANADPAATATPGHPGVPGSMAPEPATHCSGKVGDELADCLEQRNTGAVEQPPGQPAGASDRPSSPPAEGR